MKYFEVDEIRRLSDDYCEIEDAPDEIFLLTAYIAEGKPSLAEYPENVFADMSEEHPGRECTDIIANAELTLMVSERVKDVIAEVCDNEIEFLPFKIKNHRGRVEPGQYYYVNPIGAVDVLNHEESVVKYTEDSKVISVRKYVFDRKKLEVEKKHIFRVKEWPSRYFASEHLINTIKEKIPDVTNLIVRPVPVVEYEDQK